MKFTKLEKDILTAIANGKTKDDILAEKITTLKCLLLFFHSLCFLLLRVRSLCSTPPYANSLGYTFFFFSLGKKRKRMGTKKTIFIKHKLTQHFFDRKETLHKETLSLISARYLFVISRLLKFQNSDFVLKH